MSRPTVPEFSIVGSTSISWSSLSRRNNVSTPGAGFWKRKLGRGVHVCTYVLRSLPYTAGGTMGERVHLRARPCIGFRLYLPSPSTGLVQFRSHENAEPDWTAYCCCCCLSLLLLLWVGRRKELLLCLYTCEYHLRAPRKVKTENRTATQQQQQQKTRLPAGVGCTISTRKALAWIHTAVILGLKTGRDTNKPLVPHPSPRNISSHP